MSDDLIRLTGTEAVARLKRREISPLDLIDAAEKRIGSVRNGGGTPCRRFALIAPAITPGN